VILIPVKDLSGAKQRLASVLDQASRTDLAHAMLTDVADAVVASACDDIAIVTSDAFAMGLARQQGFDVIRDDSNASETDAIEMATRLCDARGIDCILVIPGDIPLLEAAEIRAIYENAPETGTVLVPSRDKRGTNAALRKPSSLFPLRFGNDSFMPHLAAAIATDKSCVVLSLPGIALDIDTPEDLHELAHAPGQRRSQILARDLGFGDAKRVGSSISLLAAKP
jgi:2-phospho-L-lactate/phosphoenolpyruvate guanylyltransferase